MVDESHSYYYYLQCNLTVSLKKKVFYFDIILPEEYSLNTEERQLWFVVGCCQYDST